MANNGEFVGISDLYVGGVKTDTPEVYEADPPVLIAPTASIAQEPSVSTKTRYYSNHPYAVSSTEGETKVTIVIPGVDIETGAGLIGKTYDKAKKRLIDSGKATVAYKALSFRADVDGGKKYYQYLKGLFAPFKEEAETQTNDIAEKTMTLEYTAICTTFSGFKIPDLEGVGYHADVAKRMVADSREDSTLTEAGWFAKVQTPDIMTTTP